MYKSTATIGGLHEINRFSVNFVISYLPREAVSKYFSTHINDRLTVSLWLTSKDEIFIK